MTETIKVSESLELHAVAENHVKPLYQLICKNKTWFNTIKRDNADKFIFFENHEHFGIAALMQHHITLHRFSRVLFTLNKLNKTAEIGYWRSEEHTSELQSPS